MDFTTALRAVDGVPVLAVAGEIDIQSEREFRDAMSEALAAASSFAVIDLEGVRFVDSAGVHVLEDARSQAVEQGVRIGLAGMREQVRRLFHITGVFEGFSAYDTLEDALVARPRP